MPEIKSLFQILPFIVTIFINSKKIIFMNAEKIEKFIIEPIGFLRSRIKYRYEAPRQGVLAGEEEAVIKLYPGNNYTQALKGLEGFERIWVIYRFHLNNNWKPLVTPPRNNGKKLGVFATRAPYRPNHLGLSCVRLLRIDKLNIYITESDILDGSPVYDIKPYLPYSDSFPDAKTGWVTTNPEEMFTVLFTPVAEEQMIWLNREAGINLEGYSKVQLSFNPFDTKRKRIKQQADKQNLYQLAYRTWRVNYYADTNNRTVTVISVTSGYSGDELNNRASDKYGDKELHLRFISEKFSK